MRVSMLIIELAGRLTVDLIAGHPVEEQRERSAEDKNGDSPVVEPSQRRLVRLVLDPGEVEKGGAAHAEAGGENVDAQRPNWCVIEDLVGIEEVRGNLSLQIVQIGSLISIVL